MNFLIDTSILVDFLRQNNDAIELLESARQDGPLHVNEMTRVELLAGMRTHEERRTRLLLSLLNWIAVDDEIAEVAGAYGREWLPRHKGIDVADLIIAATASVRDLQLLTLNVKHFPMFPNLKRPY